MHKATEYAASVVCISYLEYGMSISYLIATQGVSYGNIGNIDSATTTTTTTATALRSARSHKSKPEQAAGKLRACSLTAQAKVTPKPTASTTPK